MIRRPGRPLAALLASLLVFLPRSTSAGTPESAGTVRVGITEPSDYEVIQKGPSRGAVPVEGTWDVPREAPVPERLEARLVPSGLTEGSSPRWEPLPFDAHARGFRAALPPAPAGWYELQVRVWRNHAPESTVIVPHVGVGDLYLVVAGPPAGPISHASGQVALSEQGRWAPLDEPAGRQGSSPWVPGLGEALAARGNVPVGLIQLPEAPALASDWLPAGTPAPGNDGTSAHRVATAGGLVSDGVLFERLAGILEQRGDHGLRAAIWAGPAEPGERAPLLALLKAARLRAAPGLPWFAASPLADPAHSLLPAGAAGAAASAWADALHRALSSP